jgi:hypothetical protein
LFALVISAGAAPETSLAPGAHPATAIIKLAQADTAAKDKAAAAKSKAKSKAASDAKLEKPAKPKAGQTKADTKSA